MLLINTFTGIDFGAYCLWLSYHNLLTDNQKSNINNVEYGKEMRYYVS
jgi:hypothetical protein